jgi:hypothetical protein
LEHLLHILGITNLVSIYKHEGPKKKTPLHIKWVKIKNVINSYFYDFTQKRVISLPISQSHTEMTCHKKDVVFGEEEIGISGT